MVDRISTRQCLLFPKEPHQLLEEVGMDWWTAITLFKDGFLSFDPRRTLMEWQEQELEFRFLAGLVAMGCDSRMLRRLLEGLEKPYSYDLTQMRFNWAEAEWENCYEPEEIIEKHLEELTDEDDRDSLEAIETLVNKALEQVRGPRGLYVFDPKNSEIVQFATKLLWEIAASPLADTPETRIAVGKMYGVFQRLPYVTYGQEGRVSLTFPKKSFPTQEWEIVVQDEGAISITSTVGNWQTGPNGSDSSSIEVWAWSVQPGGAPEFQDNCGSFQEEGSVLREVERLDMNEAPDDYLLEVV
jgi:hypothetical protein